MNDNEKKDQSITTMKDNIKGKFKYTWMIIEVLATIVTFISFFFPPSLLLLVLKKICVCVIIITPIIEFRKEIGGFIVYWGKAICRTPMFKFGCFFITMFFVLTIINVTIDDKKTYTSFPTPDFSSKYYRQTGWAVEITDDPIIYYLPNLQKSFNASWSFCGSEKWYVYGRIRELQILPDELAISKPLRKETQQAKRPFVGTLKTWLDDAENIGWTCKKYVSGCSIYPGDILLWKTIIDKNGVQIKWGHLAFVEKVIDDKILVSESRMVLQTDANAIPILPNNQKYVLVCDTPQSIVYDNEEKLIFGVRLYQQPSVNSKEITTLNKFDIMEVVDGPQLTRGELCWIRVEDAKDKKNIQLIQEPRDRYWYKLMPIGGNPLKDAYWARLEDRNQPVNPKVHCIEHNFTGIGFYGHEESMYDLNEAYVIKTGAKTWPSDIR